MDKYEIPIVDLSLNSMNLKWIDSFTFTLFSNYWNLISEIRNYFIYYYIQSPMKQEHSLRHSKFLLSIYQMNEHHCKPMCVFLEVKEVLLLNERYDKRLKIY